MCAVIVGVAIWNMAIAPTHSRSQRSRKESEIDIFGLGRGRCAGRRIVTEEIFIKLYGNFVNRTARQKRRGQ